MSVLQVYFVVCPLKCAGLDRTTLIRWRIDVMVGSPGKKKKKENLANTKYLGFSLELLETSMVFTYST